MISTRCCSAHRALAWILLSMYIGTWAYGFSIESGPNKHHAPGECVYSFSASGLQLYCYADDINALNHYLNDRIEGEYEIELRPAPCNIWSGLGKESIPCTWSLAECNYDSFEGCKEALGDGRIVTIYVDDNLCPADLQIPTGIEVVSTEQLKERYRAALAHPNPQVRSFAMNLLVSSDPYDSESARQIAQLLDNLYDRNTAAMALGRFAKNVDGPLLALRAVQNKTGKRPAIENAIKKIKTAPDTRREEKVFRERNDLITEFVSTRTLLLAAASSNVN